MLLVPNTYSDHNNRNNIFYILIMNAFTERQEKRMKQSINISNFTKVRP